MRIISNPVEYPHFGGRKAEGRREEKASAKRQKAGGNRGKGRKVIVQAFEPFLTGQLFPPSCTRRKKFFYTELSGFDIIP
ncbi:MAG: hypothetical protein F6K54_38430 [Okeania sp. SIO3B5]|uniref:hypothetical protein n=1 Tax=Okeania sp. SIO3B5 TaxID=2607811 RepID=UPI00140175A9|nr:hypothetical protein [Okeania sp. SIO3B5]NEO58418.1 hypothetical protein [Okeania sp. SIO3B5]